MAKSVQSAKMRRVQVRGVGRAADDGQSKLDINAGVGVLANVKFLIQRLRSEETLSACEREYLAQILEGKEPLPRRLRSNAKLDEYDRQQIKETFADMTSPAAVNYYRAKGEASNAKSVIYTLSKFYGVPTKTIEDCTYPRKKLPEKARKLR